MNAQGDEIKPTNESQNESISGMGAMNVPAPKHRGFGWLFWLAAGALALVVTLSLINRGHEVGNASKGDRLKPVAIEGGVTPEANEIEALRLKRQTELAQARFKLEKKKLLADAEARIQKYRGDVAATVERYRKMLPLSEADAFFRKSEEGAAFVASNEGLCGWKCCAVLSYKMAYDKIKGTTRAEEAIAPIVETNVLAEIKKAVDVYAKWTADFRKELAAEECALAADLAVKSKMFEGTVSILPDEVAGSTSKALDGLMCDVREHASEAAFATVGVVLETVMIKSSYTAIKNVVVRLAGVALASVVKKAGTSIGAAGTAAVIDGPLPVGDVVGAAIAIGGLTWAAYDIYNVTQKMPVEMKEKICTSISQTRGSVEKTALENLKDVQKQCEASADQKLVELNKILGE